MKNIFNSIKISAPKSNTFDLSHDVKMSGKMGNLMPVMAMECVPGDKVTLGAETLIRFAPLIAPVMHRMDVTIHYFFSPNRIVYPDWENFITRTEDLPAPTITIDNTISTDQYRFLDYMGVPPMVAGGPSTPREINAMPFAHYQKIYMDYYRDQNLIADETDLITLDSGTNDSKINELLTLRKRAYEHDYFTASLPFAQKGAAVDIPLGDVILKNGWTPGTNEPHFEDENGNTYTGQVIGNANTISINVIPPSGPLAYNPDGTLTTESTTINDLRRAFKLQEWLEKNARGGTRYIENILVHFGVKSSDKRLQRPEYITGVKTPVVISEVLNTTGENGGLPQGNMAGHAVSVGTGYTGQYSCEEHGYIIGILSVTPKPAYQQGIPKTFLKKDALDYYWPSFANIGEQPVVTDEIYAYEAYGETAVFGYVPRYSEYKFIPPRIAGEFRTSLNYWHLGRIFDTTPTLSQEFIEIDPNDTTRIFAVEGDDADNLYMHILNKVKAVRPMPVYGTPML